MYGGALGQKTSQPSSLGATIASKNAQAENEANSSKTLEPKKAGTIRIGLAGVKTGQIGEGINAVELAGAIQNSLPQYLKGTKVEVVSLDAKLESVVFQLNSKIDSKFDLMLLEIRHVGEIAIEARTAARSIKWNMLFASLGTLGITLSMVFALWTVGYQIADFMRPPH